MNPKLLVIGSFVLALSSCAGHAEKLRWRPRALECSINPSGSYCAENEGTPIVDPRCSV